MAHDWAAAEVVVEGATFRWSLALLHWEFPGTTTGYDGNWIEAELDFVVEGPGRFTARHRTTILTAELISLADELAALLATDTGALEFETTEDETGLVIRPKDDAEGVYEVEAFVRVHTGAELRAAELEITRGQLAQAQHGLREARRAFPPRGGLND